MKRFTTEAQRAEIGLGLIWGESQKHKMGFIVFISQKGLRVSPRGLLINEFPIGDKAYVSAMIELPARGKEIKLDVWRVSVYCEHTLVIPADILTSNIFVLYPNYSPYSDGWVRTDNGLILYWDHVFSVKHLLEG